jgi:hypothetical protein
VLAEVSAHRTKAGYSHTGNELPLIAINSTRCEMNSDKLICVCMVVTDWSIHVDMDIEANNDSVIGNLGQLLCVRVCVDCTCLLVCMGFVCVCVCVSEGGREGVFVI